MYPMLACCMFHVEIGTVLIHYWNITVLARFSFYTTLDILPSEEYIAYGWNGGWNFSLWWNVMLDVSKQSYKIFKEKEDDCIEVVLKP